MGMAEPTPEVSNDWWLTVRTPTGVHAWRAGDMPTDDQIEAAIASAGGRADHSVAGRGWDVSVTAGRPRDYFLDDGTPKSARVNDVAELPPTRPSVIREAGM
jgi:hypothetical protein